MATVHPRSFSIMLDVLRRDPVRRTVARHQVVVALARRAGGFRVYNRNLAWPTDPDYLATWERFPEARRGEIRERHFTLWSIARSLRDLRGDTVECGSWLGAGSHLICSSLPGTHHIFDSFEGISEPGDRDVPSDATARKWRSGDLMGTEEQVNANLAGFDVHTYKGWIPSRFDEVADMTFRLVHVDVDLYEPTRDSVEFFYPRLVPGGVLVCDDYGSTLCDGARQAMDEYAEGIAQPVIHLTTGQGLLLAR
jgi:O-methyltransferase